MNQDDIRLLKDIYKVSQTGIYANKIIINKSKNDILKQHAKVQYENYCRSAKESSFMLKDCGAVEEDAGYLYMLSSFGKIKPKDIPNKSLSEISAMIISKSMSDIEEISQKIDSYRNINDKTRDFANNFINTQRDLIKSIK